MSWKDRLRKWVLEPGNDWRTWLGHSFMVLLATATGAGVGAVIGALAPETSTSAEAEALGWEFGKGMFWYYFWREVFQFLGHRGLTGKPGLPKAERPPIHDYVLDFFFPLVTALLAATILRTLI